MVTDKSEAISYIVDSDIAQGHDDQQKILLYTCSLVNIRGYGFLHYQMLQCIQADCAVSVNSVCISTLMSDARGARLSYLCFNNTSRSL